MLTRIHRWPLSLVRVRPRRARSHPRRPHPGLGLLRRLLLRRVAPRRRSGARGSRAVLAVALKRVREKRYVKNVHRCLPGHVCKLRDRAREMTMQAGELVASTRRGRHLGKRFYEMLSESFTVVLQLPCSQGKQGELTKNCLQNL